MKQHDWLSTSPDDAEKSARLQLKQLSNRVQEAKDARVARSQAQRYEDELNWRCGYDYMTEGALGDYPND